MLNYAPSVDADETAATTNASSEKALESVNVEVGATIPAETGEPSKQPVREYDPYKFVLLEALSATGLRAIRYAKEIPLVRCVC